MRQVTAQCEARWCLCCSAGDAEAAEDTDGEHARELAILELHLAALHAAAQQPLLSQALQLLLSRQSQNPYEWLRLGRRSHPSIPFFTSMVLMRHQLPIGSPVLSAAQNAQHASRRQYLTCGVRSQWQPDCKLGHACSCNHTRGHHLGHLFWAVHMFTPLWNSHPFALPHHCGIVYRIRAT